MNSIDELIDSKSDDKDVFKTTMTNDIDYYNDHNFFCEYSTIMKMLMMMMTMMMIMMMMVSDDDADDNDKMMISKTLNKLHKRTE